ncbi:uncharacterized protein [Periplaneta americana]|uniref:uncharacterized protein isoform X2 n=1 Tax=Periplaneta americana TaxID=6978 RepID=UPI0037E982D2
MKTYYCVLLSRLLFFFFEGNVEVTSLPIAAPDVIEDVAALVPGGVNGFQAGVQDLQEVLNDPAADAVKAFELHLQDAGKAFESQLQGDQGGVTDWLAGSQGGLLGGFLGKAI